MPPKHRSHDADPRWSLERAKREGAVTKDFDQRPPKLSPTDRHEKARTADGKFIKERTK